MEEDIYDKLPKQESLSKRPIKDARDTWWGDGFPYKRMESWLYGSAGQDVDEVLHKFKRLPWLPEELKTLKTFYRNVEKDTFMDQDGQVCYFNHYGKPVRVSEVRYRNLYVHPYSRKITLHNPPKYRWKKAKDKDVIVLDKLRQLRRINGTWFSFTATVMDPQPGAGFAPRDSSWWVTQNTEGEQILYRTVLIDTKRTAYKVVKKQLSKDELKKYGLR